MTARGSILFVDAYDSFAENIAALLHQQLSVEVILIRIDSDIPSQFRLSHQEFFSSFDAIVLGPGPGNPQEESDVGLFNQVWEYAAKDNIPVLGICLGFQSLCARYGLPVVRMDLPCHGHAKQVYHANKDIFTKSGDILATNYNSLGLRLKDVKQDSTPRRPSSSGSIDSDSFTQSLQFATPIFSKSRHDGPGFGPADNLDVLAWDRDEWVMAVRHKYYPFHGLQFHPESCKSTLACQQVIRQWWEAAKAHNKLCRSHPSISTGRRRDVSQADPLEHRSADFNSLQMKLAELGRVCGGKVIRTTVPTTSRGEEIASLCHLMSPLHASVMLESTKNGRYSIYAFPDATSFQVEYAAGQCRLMQDQALMGRFRVRREEVATLLESFLCSKSTKDDNSNAPFRGGFMGFLSYEFGTESLHLDVPPRTGPEPRTPDISLLWVDQCIVVDHQTASAHIQSIRENGKFWVEGMVARVEKMNQPKTSSSEPTFAAEKREDAMLLRDTLSSATFMLPDHDEYISQIRDCQSELLAGNSYELCLTTEARISTPATLPYSSWLLYKNIQRHNPVPFASYLRLNKTTVLSSAPEQFLSWSSRTCTIDMIPMKGTVKKTPEMNLEKATAILTSAKESAENLMIADLIRHDLYSTVGRDARVEVVKLCDIVEAETVFSLVSHVRAHVPTPVPGPINCDRKPKHWQEIMTRSGIKALIQTLPPGSMTGAPKKRSCEILHRLEQRDRGVYSGAIGYMDVGGNGAWSVCIRTAFSNDDNGDDDGQANTAEKQKTQTWRIGAGGAITVLSDEEQEWDEMMTKLDSVLRGFRFE
ncbi:aminodeoxychorismate synthase [Rhinocladiella mackenziei CBS 650.93]|uniref:aminodeoxychorismate synthase n=1 Tax=Rhinocladiella mackenziei CBS 650.93 TaxID=1442369 RepID=A0A0D2HGT7_9EURO|nr:aminodeoxychorismate synthase [Rhinocladiella mackenziei CBS 650.93]KIX09888.1 aminodeoxychorismate synthase [Rhinocladiella mackenziei CBS 650.93]